MDAEPVHARLAGWLERAFNPILVKELRGNLRGARFFAVHMTVLGLFAAGILLLLAGYMFSGGMNGEDPSRVGREVFTWVQFLHLLVVFLVVPGFAATSITTERESMTFDLLQSTTLDAQAIVWGKFVAAMAQTLTIFISMAPLVALTFLFGGVTFYQIAASYTFLIALSALMGAFATSVSAGVKSSQRAVTTVYGGSIFAGLFVVSAGAALLESRSGMNFAIAYGFVSEGSEFFRRSPRSFDTFQEVFYVYLAPAFLWVSLFLLFFLSAINKLTPLFANRSTRMRLLYLGVIVGLTGLALLAVHHDFAKESPRERAAAIGAIALILDLVTSFSLVFTCEDPILPPALAARLMAGRAGSLWRRLLMPGSVSGVQFVLFVNLLVIAASIAALVPLTRDFSTYLNVRVRVWPLLSAFLSLYAWLFLAAMVGLYLSTRLRQKPVFQKSLYLILLLGLALVPLLVYAALSADPDPTRLPGEGSMVLAFSPVGAIYSSLSAGSRHDFPTFFTLLGFRIPIALVFILNCVGGGVALRILADLRLNFLQQGLLPLRTPEAAS